MAISIIPLILWRLPLLRQSFIISATLCSLLNIELSFQERETYRFSAVAKVMRELLSGRRALLAGTLTQDQTRALRLKLVAKLDWGNR